MLFKKGEMGEVQPRQRKTRTTPKKRIMSIYMFPVIFTVGVYERKKCDAGQ